MSNIEKTMENINKVDAIRKEKWDIESEIGSLARKLKEVKKNEINEIVNGFTDLFLYEQETEGKLTQQSIASYLKDFASRIKDV
jgi:allophanate hydrolase subunit 1